MEDSRIDPSVRQLVEEVAAVVVQELWARMARGDMLVAPEFLSPKQAAQLTGFSIKSLEALRSTRAGPPYFRVGGRVRYELAAVRAWIKANGPVVD